MKLTPKKLPSGSWRVSVMVDGDRRSFTRPTKKECLAAAVAYKTGRKQEARPENLTVGRAIDRYIELKAPVLSPSTVAGYKRIRKNALQDLMDVPLVSLTQDKIQRAVNRMAAAGKSSKTIRNAHGLLSAVLDEYYPDFKLRTTLPQKRRPEIHVPDEDEIGVILRSCVGDRMELPILLALWLGLRASEIAGLTWDCVQGGYLHIKQARVLDENKKQVTKFTKTTSGDRYIKTPQRILDLIDQQPRTDEYIVHMTGQAMYKGFSRRCEKWGLPHFRFHDLRHAAASVSLLLGVPDKYSMRRMGHSTDNMLKTTYQHTLRAKEDEYAERIDGYFNGKLHTKLRTEKSGA